MQKLRVNRRTGRLREYERDIEQRGDDLLALYGFFAIKTKAEDIGRGKAGATEKYHCDRVYVRSALRPPPHVLFVEWKGPDASTNAERRAGQARFIRDRRAQGFHAFICPEGHPDPWSVFLDWFSKVIGGA